MSIVKVSVSRTSIASPIWFLSGCRTREKGLPHVQRFQADDERV